MKKTNLIFISIFILFNNFFFINLQSQINNTIVVKVGELLVTSIDIQNEIITNLVINGQEISQENINSNKGYAIKNLINKSMKRGEINKYKITNYSKKDLQNYIENIAKTLNTNLDGLKKIFKQNYINYDVFVERHKIELLWNSLIFQLYKNQINVNIIEVNTEAENINKSNSKEELEKIKINILNKKKQDKLNLFSRSHLSNLENTLNINFR
jgi:hypothetical protein